MDISQNNFRSKDLFVEVLANRVTRLEKDLKTANIKVVMLRSKLKKIIKEKSSFEQKLSKYLSSDQIDCIKGKKIVKWSVKSISKALYLRKKGRQCLNMIIKQVIPLPSLSTCNRRIKEIQYAPGILYFNLDLLAEKCKNLTPQQRNFVIAFDEIAIIPGKCFDPSTKMHFGNVTLPESESQANMALVCIIMGLDKRIKQVVACHFTDKSTKGTSMNLFLSSLVCKAENICDIKIRALSFDMGTANRSMLNILGITLNLKNEICHIMHPNRQSEKLYLVCDPTHASKNINQGVKKYGAQISSQQFCDANNLSSRIASKDDVINILTSDESFNFPLAPHLNREVLFPNQFEKMNPKNATKFHSVEVSTAIQYVNADNLAGKVSSISFVLQNLNKLHYTMTSREAWRVDTVENLHKYESATRFLRWFADVFLKNVTLGSGRLTSVFGIKISINSYINLSRSLLFDEGVESFTPSRMLTDAIENVFSILRSLTPQPSAVQVLQSLRIMSISQLQFEPIDGVYNWDEKDKVTIDFVELLKRQNPKTTANSNEFNAGIHLTQNYSWPLLFDSKLDFNSFVCFLSCLIGKIFKKIKCRECRDWIQASEIHDMKEFDGYELLSMRHLFDEKYFYVPSLDILQLGLNLEFLMRCFSQLISLDSPNFKKQFIASSLFLNEIQVFHCPDVILIIAEPFTSSRIRMLLHKREKHKAVTFASKSIK